MLAPNWWIWLLAFLGAFLIGISKGGIAGVGIMAVPIFALIFPARASTGLVLIMLICADVIAVSFYRRHALWHHLWRLFPWAVTGILIGFFTMGHIDDRGVARLIGAILLVMLGLQWRRKVQARQSDKEMEAPTQWWIAPITGIMAGFTTMVANAAGPIMIMYLLAMRLPKMEFVGTAAWYFLILNCFKVPFSYQLGLINLQSLTINAILAPVALVGVFSGRYILGRIDQQWFENIALFFTLLAGVRLLM